MVFLLLVYIIACHRFCPTPSTPSSACSAFIVSNATKLQYIVIKSTMYLYNELKSMIVVAKILFFPIRITHIYNYCLCNLLLGNPKFLTTHCLFCDNFLNHQLKHSQISQKVDGERVKQQQKIQANRQQ